MPQLLPLLTTAFSALIGAAAGAIAALSRFKRERAFDRRLQWFDEIIPALRQTQRDLLAVVISLDAIDDPEERKTQWVFRSAEPLERLAPLIDKAMLVASSVTLSKLTTIEAAMTTFTATSRLSSVKRDATGFDQLVAVSRFSESLDLAIKALASDVRADLGLARLP